MLFQKEKIMKKPTRNVRTFEFRSYINKWMEWHEVGAECRQVRCVDCENAKCQMLLSMRFDVISVQQLCYLDYFQKFYQSFFKFPVALFTQYG